MFPEIGALGIASGFEAEQLQIVFTEDRQMVAGPERVVTALAELKPEPAISCRGAIEFPEDIDDSVIQNGDGLEHIRVHRCEMAESEPRLRRKSAFGSWPFDVIRHHPSRRSSFGRHPPFRGPEGERGVLRSVGV
jgi:hypothetical protein